MKKILVALLVIVFAVGLVGCGSSDTGADSTILTVGATPVPHAQLLELAKPLLAEEGIELKIQEYTDYVTPNIALSTGEIQANYFQTIAYLENENETRNLGITYLTKVHFEAMGVYSKKVDSFEDLADGAKVAIPNEVTNGSRALFLLEKAGLITLKEGLGITDATVFDIVDNPKNIQVIELEPAQLPRSLDDVNLAVINGNYALEAGLDPANDALLFEDQEANSDDRFTNVLAIKEGAEDDPNIQALHRILTSEAVRDMIEEKWQGIVVPTF